MGCVQGVCCAADELKLDYGHHVAHSDAQTARHHDVRTDPKNTPYNDLFIRIGKWKLLAADPVHQIDMKTRRREFEANNRRIELQYLKGRADALGTSISGHVSPRATPWKLDVQNLETMEIHRYHPLGQEPDLAPIITRPALTPSRPGHHVEDPSEYQAMFEVSPEHADDWADHLMQGSEQDWWRQTLTSELETIGQHAFEWKKKVKQLKHGWASEAVKLHAQQQHERLFRARDNMIKQMNEMTRPAGSWRRHDPARFNDRDEMVSDCLRDDGAWRALWHAQFMDRHDGAQGQVDPWLFLDQHTGVVWGEPHHRHLKIGTLALKLRVTAQMQRLQTAEVELRVTPFDVYVEHNQMVVLWCEQIGEPCPARLQYRRRHTREWQDTWMHGQGYWEHEDHSDLGASGGISIDGGRKMLRKVTIDGLDPDASYELHWKRDERQRDEELRRAGRSDKRAGGPTPSRDDVSNRAFRFRCKPVLVHTKPEPPRLDISYPYDWYTCRVADEFQPAGYSAFTEGEAKANQLGIAGVETRDRSSSAAVRRDSAARPVAASAARPVLKARLFSQGARQQSAAGFSVDEIDPRKCQGSFGFRREQGKHASLPPNLMLNRHTGVLSGRPTNWEGIKATGLDTVVTASCRVAGNTASAPGAEHSSNGVNTVLVKGDTKIAVQLVQVTPRSDGKSIDVQWHDVRPNPTKGSAEYERGRSQTERFTSAYSRLWYRLAPGQEHVGTASSDNSTRSGQRQSRRTEHRDDSGWTYAEEATRKEAAGAPGTGNKVDVVQTRIKGLKPLMTYELKLMPARGEWNGKRRVRSRPLLVRTPPASSRMMRKQFDLGQLPGLPALQVGDHVNAIDSLGRWSPGRLTKVEPVSMHDAEVGVEEVMLLDVEFDSEADTERRLAYREGQSSLHRSPFFQSSPLVRLGIEEPLAPLDVTDRYAPSWRADLVQALPDPPKPYTPCPDFTIEMSTNTSVLGSTLNETVVRASLTKEIARFFKYVGVRCEFYEQEGAKPSAVQKTIEKHAQKPPQIGRPFPHGKRHQLFFPDEPARRPPPRDPAPRGSTGIKARPTRAHGQPSNMARVRLFGPYIVRMKQTHDKQEIVEKYWKIQPGETTMEERQLTPSQLSMDSEGNITCAALQHIDLVEQEYAQEWEEHIDPSSGHTFYFNKRKADAFRNASTKQKAQEYKERYNNGNFSQWAVPPAVTTAARHPQTRVVKNSSLTSCSWVVDEDNIGNHRQDYGQMVRWRQDLRAAGVNVTVGKLKHLNLEEKLLQQSAEWNPSPHTFTVRDQFLIQQDGEQLAWYDLTGASMYVDETSSQNRRTFTVVLANTQKLCLEDLDDQWSTWCTAFKRAGVVVLDSQHIGRVAFFDESDEHPEWSTKDRTGYMYLNYDLRYEDENGVIRGSHPTLRSWYTSGRYDSQWQRRQFTIRGRYLVQYEERSGKEEAWYDLTGSSMVVNAPEESNSNSRTGDVDADIIIELASSAGAKEVTQLAFIVSDGYTGITGPRSRRPGKERDNVDAEAAEWRQDLISAGVMVDEAIQVDAFVDNTVGTLQVKVNFDSTTGAYTKEKDQTVRELVQQAMKDPAVDFKTQFVKRCSETVQKNCPLAADTKKTPSVYNQFLDSYRENWPTAMATLEKSKVQVRWTNPDSMPQLIWRNAKVESTALRITDGGAERCNVLHYDPDTWTPHYHVKYHNMTQKNFRVTQVPPVLGEISTSGRVLRDSAHNRSLLHRKPHAALTPDICRLLCLSLIDIPITDNNLMMIAMSQTELRELNLSRTHVSDMGIKQAMVDRTTGKLTHLHTLYLDECNGCDNPELGSSGADPAHSSQIQAPGGALVPRKPNLGITDQVFRHLYSEGSVVRPTLRRLSTRGCKRVSDQGLMWLLRRTYWNYGFDAYGDDFGYPQKLGKTSAAIRDCYVTPGISRATGDCGEPTPKSDGVTRVNLQINAAMGTETRYCNENNEWRSGRQFNTTLSLRNPIFALRNIAGDSQLLRSAAGASIKQAKTRSKASNVDPFDVHSGTCGNYSIECKADPAVVAALAAEGYREEACKRAALAVSQAAIKDPWRQGARVKAALEWADAHKDDADFNAECPSAYVREKCSDRSSFSGRCEVLRIHVQGLLSRVSALELQVTPITRDELEWRKMELQEMKRRDPQGKSRSWAQLPEPPQKLRRVPMRATIAIQKDDDAVGITEAAERAAALKRNRGRYVFDGEFAQVVNTDGIDHFDVRLIPTPTTRQTDAERTFQRRASKRVVDSKTAWQNAHMDFMEAMGHAKSRSARTRIHYWGPAKVKARGSRNKPQYKDEQERKRATVAIAHAIMCATAAAHAAFEAASQADTKVVLAQGGVAEAARLQGSNGAVASHAADQTPNATSAVDARTRAISMDNEVDTTIDLEVRKIELVRHPLVATRIDDQGVRRPQLHLQGSPDYNCILGVVEPDPLELLCIAANTAADAMDAAEQEVYVLTKKHIHLQRRAESLEGRTTSIQIGSPEEIKQRRLEWELVSKHYMKHSVPLRRAAELYDLVWRKNPDGISGDVPVRLDELSGVTPTEASTRGLAALCDMRRFPQVNEAVLRALNRLPEVAGYWVFDNEAMLASLRPNSQEQAIVRTGAVHHLEDTPDDTAELIWRLQRQGHAMRVMPAALPCCSLLATSPFTCGRRHADSQRNQVLDPRNEVLASQTPTADTPVQASANAPDPTITQRSIVLGWKTKFGGDGRDSEYGSHSERVKTSSQLGDIQSTHHRFGRPTLHVVRMRVTGEFKLFRLSKELLPPLRYRLRGNCLTRFVRCIKECGAPPPKPFRMADPVHDHTCADCDTEEQRLWLREEQNLAMAKRAAGHGDGLLDKRIVIGSRVNGREGIVKARNRIRGRPTQHEIQFVDNNTRLNVVLMKKELTGMKQATTKKVPFRFAEGEDDEQEHRPCPRRPGNVSAVSTKRKPTEAQREKRKARVAIACAIVIARKAAESATTAADAALKLLRHASFFAGLHPREKLAGIVIQAPDLDKVFGGGGAKQSQLGRKKVVAKLVGTGSAKEKWKQIAAQAKGVQSHEEEIKYVRDSVANTAAVPVLGLPLRELDVSDTGITDMSNWVWDPATNNAQLGKASVWRQIDLAFEELHAAWQPHKQRLEQKVKSRGRNMPKACWPGLVKKQTSRHGTVQIEVVEAADPRLDCAAAHVDRLARAAHPHGLRCDEYMHRLIDVLAVPSPMKPFDIKVLRSTMERLANMLMDGVSTCDEARERERADGVHSTWHVALRLQALVYRRHALPMLMSSTTPSVGSLESEICSSIVSEDHPGYAECRGRLRYETDLQAWNAAHPGFTAPPLPLSPRQQRLGQSAVSMMDRDMPTCRLITSDREQRIEQRMKMS